MTEQISSFQERLILLVGGVTVSSLALMKRRPSWAGIILAGTAAALIPVGLRWVRFSNSPRPSRRVSPPALDVVAEGSEESFPASDSPAWVVSTIP